MKHTWTYANMGGNTRVIIKNGKDIQHLAELDEKLVTRIDNTLEVVHALFEEVKKLVNNNKK